MNAVRITTGRRVEGLMALSRRLGYSASHLSLVLHGHRPASRTLASRLRRMGLEVTAGVRKGVPRKGAAE